MTTSLVSAGYGSGDRILYVADPWLIDRVGVEHSGQRSKRTGR